VAEVFRICARLLLAAALLLPLPAAAVTVTNTINPKFGTHYENMGFRQSQHLWTRLRFSTDDGWTTLRIEAEILGDIDRVSHLDFRFYWYVPGSPEEPRLQLLGPPPVHVDGTLQWTSGAYVYQQVLYTIDPRLGGSYTALVSMTHAGQQTGMAGALLAGFQQDLFFFGGELRYRSTITFSQADLAGTEVTLLAGDVAPVPLPAGLPLLAAGLLALALRRG
jgi:hypothetical protein